MYGWIRSGTVQYSLIRLSTVRYGWIRSDTIKYCLENVGYNKERLCTVGYGFIGRERFGTVGYEYVKICMRLQYKKIWNIWNNLNNFEKLFKLIKSQYLILNFNLLCFLFRKIWILFSMQIFIFDLISLYLFHRYWYTKKKPGRFFFPRCKIEIRTMSIDYLFD